MANYVSYAASQAPALQQARSFHNSGIKGPLPFKYLPSTYAPVPVAAALKGGTSGSAYSEAITAQGGTSPYTFAITSGALPAGTTMSSGGVITGTPTTTGTASFTVTVTDSLGYTGSQAFTVVVSAPASSGGGAYTFVV